MVTERLKKHLRPLAFAGILALLLTALGLSVLNGPRPVEAAFPGVNGKILFQSNRDSNQEIYIMNTDGSQQVNLTRNFAVDNRGAWSADRSEEQHV